VSARSDPGTGPSATVDIELTRAEGVQGPRKLDIILVRDEPNAARAAHPESDVQGKT